MISIRPMTLADAEAVAAIEKCCFSLPWSAEAIKESLQNPASCFLAAEEAGALIGYIGLYFVAGEGQILNIATHPDHRRKGCGRALMEAAVAEAKNVDITSLFLEVRASNAPAIALYEGLGFSALGKRKHFYTHPTEDALVMGLNIC